MLALHPQYIKDTAGNNLVVLPEQEFDMLLEELEEMAEIGLYDEVKKNDTGERIPMDEAFKQADVNRKPIVT